MLTRMLDLAQYELLNYPHRGLGYYLLRPFKILSGRDNDPQDRMDFPNGLLAKAMMDYYKKHTNTEEAREIMELVKRYYSRWFIGGYKLYSPMDAYAGIALIDLHQITQNEKYKEAADRILQFLMDFNTDNEGTFLLKDHKGLKQNVYAEIIAGACPFLAKYSKTYDHPGAMNLALVQVENFLNHGMDEKSLLPYHGYDTISGMKMGIIGWGQATGFLLLGLSDILHYMNSEHVHYEALRQAYRRVVDKVENYQYEDGLYRWQLSAKDGPADTAATAMILVSIAQSIEDKVLIGVHKSRMLRGMQALKMCVQEDGSLPGAAMKASDYNMYPMIFDSYPWSLGPALSLFLITEEEKVKTTI